MQGSAVESISATSAFVTASEEVSTNPDTDCCAELMPFEWRAVHGAAEPKPGMVCARVSQVLEHPYAGPISDGCILATNSTSLGARCKPTQPRLQTLGGPMRELWVFEPCSFPSTVRKGLLAPAAGHHAAPRRAAETAPPHRGAPGPPLPTGPVTALSLPLLKGVGNLAIPMGEQSSRHCCGKMCPKLER